MARERVGHTLQTTALVDVRKSKVVEMRFFGGSSVEQTAAVPDVSVETVMRDWKFSTSRLRHELRRER